MSGSLNVGIVTRTDDDYVYVWSASHRTTEAKISKSDSADVLPGDVVQYHQSGSLKEPQTDAKLTRVQNHDLSVLYHPKNPSYFRIKTTFLTPEKGIYDEDYDPRMVRSVDVSVKFFAFSIEFGKVASFVNLEHSPGKVYRGYITRLPIDDTLTRELDTIFGIVDMELKEVTDPYVIMDAKKHAPWHDKLVHHRSRASSMEAQHSPSNSNDVPYMCDPALMCQDEPTTRVAQREMALPAPEGRSSCLIFDDPPSRKPTVVSPESMGLLLHDSTQGDLSAAPAPRNASDQPSRMLFPPISNCKNSSSSVPNNRSRVLSSDDDYSTMLFGGAKVNENSNANRRDFLTASDLYNALHTSTGEFGSAVNDVVWDEDDENKRKKHVSWGGTEYNIFEDLDSIDPVNDCLMSNTDSKAPTPESLTTDLLDLRQGCDDYRKNVFSSNSLLDLSREISTQLRLKSTEALSDIVSLNVHMGVRPTYDEASQVVLIGRNKNMCSLEFRGELASKLRNVGVDERIFNAAVNHIKFYGPTTIPLYLHLVKMISVNDEPTVRNSSSYTSAIYRELMEVNVEKGIRGLNIILYTEHKNMLANVSSAALCFPLHPNVASSLKPYFRQVNIEVVITDEGMNLPDDDVKFLRDVVSLVRECNTTASMASEALNAQWRNIWFTI